MQNQALSSPTEKRLIHFNCCVKHAGICAGYDDAGATNMLIHANGAEKHDSTMH